MTSTAFHGLIDTFDMREMIMSLESEGYPDAFIDMDPPTVFEESLIKTPKVFTTPNVRSRENDWQGFRTFEEEQETEITDDIKRAIIKELKSQIYFLTEKQVLELLAFKLPDLSRSELMQFYDLCKEEIFEQSDFQFGFEVVLPQDDTDIDSDEFDTDEEAEPMQLRSRSEIKPADRLDTKDKSMTPNTKKKGKKQADEPITPKAKQRRGRPKKNKEGDELSTSVKDLTSPMLKQKRKYTKKTDSVEIKTETSTETMTSSGSASVVTTTPMEVQVKAPSMTIPLARTHDERYYRNKGYIGNYSPDKRREMLTKYLLKRKERIWTKRIKYEVRKSFADSRMRVKGRFISKQNEDELREQLLLMM